MRGNVMSDTLIVHINDGPALAGSLSVDQETIRQSTNLPQPNPRWEFTDSNGHYHAHSDDKDHPYPTLNAVAEQVGCDGSCGGTCDDEGYTTRYFCRACGEKIQPGSIRGPHHFTIPGPKNWTVSVEGHVDREMNEKVSVRVESDGQQYFGVAQVVGGSLIRHVDDEVRVTTELVGISPLGRRKV